MISHQHKTIYVHIPKTGGQSIETVFLSMLGLAWEDRAPLLLRPNQNPKLGPPRLAHLLAKQYYEYHYISRDLFEQYFVFSFVRNPWDRAVSFYRYLGYASKISLEEFLLRHLKPAVCAGHWFVRPQSDFILDNKLVNVDYVGRYETLERDFQHILNQLNLPSTPLPHINRSPVAHSQKTQWSQAAADIIGDIYHADVINFGYQFPQIVNHE